MDMVIAGPVAEATGFTELADTGNAAAKPARPQPEDRVRHRTQMLLEDCRDSVEFTDDKEQFLADLKTLFPGGGRNKKIRSRIANSRTLSKSEVRSKNREVIIPHVFRYAQQTFALVGASGYSAKFTPKQMVTPRAQAKPSAQGDVIAGQFAKTLELEMADAIEQGGLRGEIRTWVQHGIWFRRAIIKSWFHRDWRIDPIGSEPDQELEQQIARLKHLMERKAWGEIAAGSEDEEEIRTLTESIQEAGAEIGDEEGWIEAEVVPPNRFRCDPRIKSWRKVNLGRFQVFDYLLTVGEVRERFPYKDNGDGTWEGIHPDDLAAAQRVNENGDQQTAQQAERWSQAVKDGKARADDEFVMLHEQWRKDCRTVYWLLDGVDYPLGEWRPEKPTKDWYPTQVLVLNEKPEAAAGISDTEILGPVQDRMNAKDSDGEESRELAAGVQGLYHAGLTDAEMMGKIIEFVQSGKRGLHGINGPASQKISDLVTFLEHPHNPLWFDKSDDERMARFLARLPEQQMGITDGKTTATAIMTANQGSQVATNDKRQVVQERLALLHRQWAELLLLNLDPVKVRTRRGEFAYWPRFLDSKERAHFQAVVDQRVNARITEEMMAEHTQHMMAGDPNPEPDLAAIDAMVAQATSETWLEVVGDDEPFDRMELFQHLDVGIDVSMEGSDLLQRAQVVANLGSMFMGMGLKVTNADPLGRLLAKLAGPDSELEDAFGVDPSELVRRLAEVAAKDPNALTPDAQAVLAQLGMAAQAQMMQAQAQEQAKAQAQGGDAVTEGVREQGGLPAPAGMPGAAPVQPRPPAAGAPIPR